MVKIFEEEQIIVKKIASLIKREYLDNADLFLQENK